MDNNQLRKLKIAQLSTALLSMGWPEWLVDGFALALAGANLLGSEIRSDFNVVEGLRVSHHVRKTRGTTTVFDRRDRSGFEFNAHTIPGEGLLEVDLSNHSIHEPLPRYLHLTEAVVPVSTDGLNFSANLVKVLADNGRHHNDGEKVTVGADIFVFAILAHEMRDEGLDVRVTVDNSSNAPSASMYIGGNGHDVFVTLDLLRVTDHVQTGGRGSTQLH